MEQSDTAQFVLELFKLIITWQGVVLILGSALVVTQRKAIDAVIRKLVKLEAGPIKTEFQKESLLTELVAEGVDIAVAPLVDQSSEPLNITFPRLTETEINALDHWLVPATRSVLMALSNFSAQHTPWQVDYQMSTVIADANERAAILGALFYAGLIYLDGSNLTIIVSNRGQQYVQHRESLLEG